VLDSNGQPDEIRRHARRQLFLRGQLLMGCRRRMDGQGLGIADIGEMGNQGEGIDEFFPCFQPTLDPEAENAACSQGEIFVENMPEWKAKFAGMVREIEEMIS